MSENLGYTIQQETTTILVADEDKILVRAETGSCATEIVHLGVDWYKEGIPLSVRQMASPAHWKAIPKPENWGEEDYDPNTLIDQFSVMRITQQMFHQRASEAESLELTNRQKHELKSAHAVWGVGMDAGTIATFKALEVKVIVEGDTVDPNTTFIYKGDIFKPLTTHTAYAHFVPGPTTLALYRIIPEQDGTIEDPIEYKQGMMADLGEIFIEDGVKYECIRVYDGSTAHMPSQLKDDYFKVVEDAAVEEEGSTTEDSGTTAELGTEGNPIPYVPLDLIPLEAGLYYTQDGVVYYCHNAAAATGHNLSALVPNHVQVVEQ